jgi:tetratricopeptide (TPR) repeat protein
VWFWPTRSAEWRYWLDALLRLPDAQVPSPMRLRALFESAIQALLLEDIPRCRALRDEYLALATDLNDRGAQINSLYLTGYVCLGRGDYCAAAAAFDEGLAKSTEAANQFWIAYFGCGLGMSLLVRHEYDRAEAVLQAALKILVEIGWRFGSIMIMTALGYIALEKQEAGRARDLLQQAAEGSIAIGFESELPDCLNGLAGVALQENDLLRAAQLYGAVDALAQRFGVRTHEPALIPFNERNLAALRQRLAPIALERAWQVGRAMSLSEALSVALSAGR